MNYEMYPLCKELYDLVIEEYNLNDTGHRLEHVMDVMSTADAICQRIAQEPFAIYPHNSSMEYTKENRVELQIAIAFHDMFSRFRDCHEKLAANWVNYHTPKILEIAKKHYPDVEPCMDSVISAILNHRASQGGYENYEPTSWFGEIDELVAVADCGRPTINLDVYARSYQYAYPLYDTDEERILHAFNHVKEKFGKFAFACRSRMFQWIYGKENEEREVYIKEMTLERLIVELPKYILAQDFEGDSINNELSFIARNPDVSDIME